MMSGMGAALEGLLLLVGLPVCFVAGGVYLVLSGRRRISADTAFTRKAHTAQALVTHLNLETRYKVSSDRLNNPTWWLPWVKFTLPDGSEVEAPTMVGGTPQPAKVGETVNVKYDPDDPERVNLASGWAQHSTIGTIHVVLGTVLSAVGLASLGLVGLVTWMFGFPG